MRDVYLIGIGQTKITKNTGVRCRYMATEAIEKALEHAAVRVVDRCLSSEAVIIDLRLVKLGIDDDDEVAEFVVSISGLGVLGLDNLDDTAIGIHPRDFGCVLCVGADDSPWVGSFAINRCRWPGRGVSIARWGRED